MRRRRLPRLLFGCLAIVLSLWLGPLDALANSAPVYTRWFPESGGIVTPTTTTKVRIERERLLFDLTREPGVARVEARYDVVNVTPEEVALDLAFIAPAGGDFQADLDGQPLQTRYLDEQHIDLPPEWRYPMSTVDARTGQERRAPGNPTGGSVYVAQLQLCLPANGRGTLGAAYRAKLGHNQYDENLDLLYVLGPAKRWAGFGALEVEALVPSDQVMASLPALELLGEANGAARYGGRFDGLPSELLRLAIAPRDPAAGQPTGPASGSVSVSPLLGWQGPIGFSLPIVIALAVGFLVGSAARQIRRPVMAALVAGPLGLVITGLVAVALSLWTVQAIASSDPELAPSGDIGAMLITLFSAAILAPAIGAITAAVRAAQRPRQPTD